MAGVIVNTAAYTARVLVLTAYPHLQFIAVYFVMFAHSSPLSWDKFFPTDLGQWFLINFVLLCWKMKVFIKEMKGIYMILIACRTYINVFLELE